jgi:hypothetical protein
VLLSNTNIQAIIDAEAAEWRELEIRREEEERRYRIASMAADRRIEATYES